MSGIIGIYYLDGQPVKGESLGRMVDIIAHRGPDGADVWCEGSVGLGHRMLWTTPESLLEKLPLIDQTGNLVITADARIDNRDELIKALSLDDCPAEKITDSQLILAAYEKWGEQCPEKLLGDFAFAIWDKCKQILFCARDHFGVKPFHYYHSGQIFVFASEIKALFCLPEVPRHLNEVRVADYLANLFDDKSITFYHEIFRLPPAHTMVVSQEEIKIRLYWSLDASLELQLSSDEEYAEAFRELFTEAVRCRLRSAFPVGSSLSGGLDSSSIVCVARQLIAEETNSSLHTFSYIFENIPECDERPFINSVVEKGGLIPHYILGDKFGPFLDWERVFWHTDATLLGPNTYLPWGLFRAAQQEGVRILLDGFDGDTTVSHGVFYLNELARQGQWAAFATNTDGLSKNFGNSPLDIFKQYGLKYFEELACQWRWGTFTREVQEVTKYFTISRRDLFLHHGFKPLVPKFVRQTWRALRGRNESTESINPIISHNFTQRISLKERIQSLDESWLSQPLTAREAQWHELTSGLITLPLEVMHLTAPAFSVEPRHPFMDKRLIEFCLALPPQQKLHQGWTRMIMRRAMANILPEQVQWRGGKANYEQKFVHGLLTIDREIVDEVMLNDLESIEAYVDTHVLQEVYQRLISPGKAKSEDALALWAPVALALWRRYTEQLPPST